MSVLPDSTAMGVSLTTSTNAAYNTMKQDLVLLKGYELMNAPQNEPKVTNVEPAYESPSVLSQPIPDIPPTCKTEENEDDEEEVYEVIPGEK